MRKDMLNKTYIIGLVILFVCVSFTGSTYSLSMKRFLKFPFKANILYVGGSGEENYTKIQDAIDNSSNGDTIYVYNGSYYENVEVDKSINLVGEDKDITIIDGSGSGIGFYIPMNWVNISGFTIKHNEFGILLEDSYSNHNTISGNIISSNKYWGINLDSASAYNIVQDNTFSENDIGLHLHHSYRNTIINNYIVSNKEYGISLHYLCNKTINSYNNYAIKGYSYGENIIYNNYFDNNNNAWDDGENTWNITKTAGTNIIGGQWLGGNYWSNYKGNDLDGDGLGDIPFNISGGNNKDYLPLTNLDNHPPNIPKVAGPMRPKVGIEYEYIVWTIDPDEDDVSYYIDWGDGNIPGWTAPLGSGEEWIMAHAWNESGTYLFKCKAKDYPYNAESDWFEWLIIVPPKDKVTNNILFLNLLEKIPLLEEFINTNRGSGK